MSAVCQNMNRADKKNLSDMINGVKQAGAIFATGALAILAIASLIDHWALIVDILTLGTRSDPVPLSFLYAALFVGSVTLTMSEPVSGSRTAKCVRWLAILVAILSLFTFQSVHVDVETLNVYQQSFWFGGLLGTTGLAVLSILRPNGFDE